MSPLNPRYPQNPYRNRTLEGTADHWIKPTLPFLEKNRATIFSMNLDKVWGVLLVCFLQFILGLASLLATISLLPQSMVDVVTNNVYVHTLLLTLYFVISFSLSIFIWRKNSTNKVMVARNFGIIYFLSYILNPIFNHDLTALFVAVLFPILAYLLTRLIVVESKSFRA